MHKRGGQAKKEGKELQAERSMYEAGARQRDTMTMSG